MTTPSPVVWFIQCKTCGSTMTKPQTTRIKGCLQCQSQLITWTLIYPVYFPYDD
jgi:hypothetical protein